MKKYFDYKVAILAVVMMFVVGGVQRFIDDIPGEDYVKKVPILSTFLRILPFYFFLLAVKIAKRDI